MGKLGKIINVNDTLYEVLGNQSVKSVDIEGADVWKNRWGADTLLRNGDIYYFCRNVLNAEFDDIKEK
jgi:hypothetical protein|tara:strand:- start:1379 stop:1582 length:204 start_codon:yes stop_codon:yes gene_type:complete